MGGNNSESTTGPTTGVLTEWRDERGYGFITPDDGSQKVFLHIKSMVPGQRRPEQWDFIYYKLDVDERGRPCAKEAFLRSVDRKRPAPFLHAFIGWLAKQIWLAVIPYMAYGLLTRRLWAAMGLTYLGNSLMTILFYWDDKFRAQKDLWRLPEILLHYWELLCGWPGALCAQNIFRHKRNKLKFMLWFLACAMLNVLALCLLFYAMVK